MNNWRNDIISDLETNETEKDYLYLCLNSMTSLSVEKKKKKQEN